MNNIYDNIINYINSGSVLYKDLTDVQISRKILGNEDLIEMLKKDTGFLDVYGVPVTVKERIYYLLKNIDSAVKCPICGMKSKWNNEDRISHGYIATCGKKECKSRYHAEKQTGNTKVSDNHATEFIKWQESVCLVTDELIEKNIKYEKYLDLIDNKRILDYMNNRFPDSDSMEETYERILLHIEKKPKCKLEGCNNPVKWKGRSYIKSRGLFDEYCCREHAGISESTQKKRRQTNIEKYGTENIYDSKKYQEKYREQYGVDFSTQRKDIIEKKKNVMREKYGVECSLQIPEVKENIKIKNIEKYGTEYPSQNDEVKKLIKNTFIEKYGQDNPMKVSEISEKAKQTCIEKYGKENPMQNEEIRDKHRNTCIERYDVEYPMQYEEFLNKSKETCFKKYGVKNPLQNEDVKKKSRETCFKKYGTEIPMQNEEIKKKQNDKMKKTFMKRYGVGSAFELDEVREKAYESMKENSKIHKSKKEDEVYEIIKNIYPDTIRYYRTKDFPYNVDFYIPCLDLRIEYQGSQFHHGRAYLNTNEDKNDYLKFNKKSEESKRKEEGKKSQYDNIIYVWSELDVRKRELALKNKLNYLEIYSFHDKDDIINQINTYVLCKNGCIPLNYDNEVIEREYNYYKNMNITEYSEINSYTGKNSIIKIFQFNEFYKEEMKLYAENPVIRRKLIQNRMEYLRKKEYMLKMKDIMRGFKISGIHYGYSHFNPQYTNWFVKKYNIKTIYDPCGGWGHHMLGMLSCEKIIYNEINENVYDNVNKIKEKFRIENLYMNNGDGTEYEPENVDAFFMCPPYYNVEVYNDKKYDSLEEYGKFLNLIFDIWKKNSAKIFGIVLREDFVDLINYKYSEKYMIKVTSMHFSRKNKKRYNEYFYIFNK